MIKDRVNDDEIGDFIMEVADSWVPVYTSQLIELAKENYWLLCTTPERGTSAGNTPLSLLIANVYEYLNNELWKRYEED